MTPDPRLHMPRFTAIPGGQSCIIDQPGTGCVAVTWLTGYYQAPNTFVPFQHTAGTGPQFQQIITMSPVHAACVYANDIDLDAEVYFRQSGVNPPPLTLTGDRNWTAFSDGSACATAQPPIAQIDWIRLTPDANNHPQSNDYVNWNVTVRPSASDPTWCNLTATVTSCNGIEISVGPSFVQSSYLRPFQGAVSGTSHAPIEIQFGEDLYKVQVTAVDPDAAGTHMIAYNAAGDSIQQVEFSNDNTPTRYSQDTRAITSSVGIRRIRLVSAADDGVAFKGLTVWRSSYALTIDGPETMPPGGPCYYYASASGVAPYTYQWSWTTSDGGSAGGYSPSPGVFALAAQSQYGKIHLSLATVDATGNTATATKTITISTYTSYCSG
jgi:hypothetical protein